MFRRTWKLEGWKMCTYLIFGDRRPINSSLIGHVTQKSLPLIERIRMGAILTEKFKFTVPPRWVLIPLCHHSFIAVLYSIYITLWNRNKFSFHTFRTRSSRRSKGIWDDHKMWSWSRNEIFRLCPKGSEVESWFNLSQITNRIDWSINGQ